jgi:RecB family exonuclease
LLEGTDQRVVIDRIIKSKQGNYLIIDYKTGADEKSKLELFNNVFLKLCIVPKLANDITSGILVDSFNL